MVRVVTGRPKVPGSSPGSPTNRTAGHRIRSRSTWSAWPALVRG